jgi:glycine dehydrogenase subunit 1
VRDAALHDQRSGHESRGEAPSPARCAMSRYTYVTAEDRADMLRTVGVKAVADLYADIPPQARLGHGLDLAAGKSELEVTEHIRALATRNTSADDEVSFIGGGMYDHFVPAVIDSIASRSEFLTPYTPYQPEVAQGGLQVMFEYQTAISELTGLPVSNASVYDGVSGVAAAAYMAFRVTGHRRILISRGVHPQARAAVRTLAAGFGASVEELALEPDTARTVLTGVERETDVSAVIVQQPNFLGAIEELEVVSRCARSAGALSICSADPIALGILRTPGEQGIDICVGEGQALGGNLSFGGPSFGFFAATQSLAREMPGRIAGETIDVDGRRGFALVLQTREQHIRRERATSNICTAQAHNALCAMLYMAWLGKQGLAELSELLVRRTAYLRQQIERLEGVTTIPSGPVVREFAVVLDGDAKSVIDACLAWDINPGLDISGDYPDLGQVLLIAVTERRTREDLDRLHDALGHALRAPDIDRPLAAA